MRRRGWLSRERYLDLAGGRGPLRGLKPVVIAIVLQALWGLGRITTRTRTLAAVGLLSLAAAVGGVHELAVIFFGGALVGLVTWARLGTGRGRTRLLRLLGR